MQNQYVNSASMRTMCFVVVLLCPVSLRAATLVKDGKATSAILLPAEPNEVETMAADELTTHLEKMSAAKLETVRVANDELAHTVKSLQGEGKTPILLGRLAPDRLQAKVRKASSLSGAFALEVRPDLVCMAGAGDGTVFGAYEALEQLGVRWFMPGELGTVIPSTKTIQLAQQETIQAPSFAGRYFQMNGAPADWLRRLRCGGVPQFPSSHGLPGLGRGVFKDHPEYFALIDGERNPRQHCLSNPDVLEIVVSEVKKRAEKNPDLRVVGLGPNDGGGFCQCDGCRALDGGDFDPFSGELSVTDRYIWFFNRVLEKTQADHPDLKLGFYIYHNYMRPPVKEKPHPNITGALAPIALCRAHGPDNHLCPEKQYYERLARAWGELMPELWERGYWSNLACPGFPFIITERLRKQIPMGKAAGVTGWRVETFANYGPQLPSFYIAAKLMWNADADVDALMDDFATRFFGPAAEPMGRYVTLMAEALRDADHHTGCSWDMPYFYPASVRREARDLLDQGAKLASGQGIYQRRVKMIRETFDLLEHFIAMMQARVEVDFVAANKHLERMDAVAATLMEYDPPMLLSGRFSTYNNYTRRFFRPCTEQGYKRVTGGNRLVAACQDQWRFLIDPLRVGEDLGYWRSKTDGGNWQQIKTSSSSWSNQGLRYYKGLAWYRQTVDVPAEFKGDRVFLWCGGVDEKAKVWVNDVPVGISHEASFYPFELDVTEAIQAGRPNTVVMAVLNERVNELGTGGIVAPVILYAPAEGKDAQLDNSRPLGETFP
jgi:hypothetical protein